MLLELFSNEQPDLAWKCFGFKQVGPLAKLWSQRPCMDTRLSSSNTLLEGMDEVQFKGTTEGPDGARKRELQNMSRATCRQST